MFSNASAKSGASVLNAERAALLYFRRNTVTGAQGASACIDIFTTMDDIQLTDNQFYECSCDGGIFVRALAWPRVLKPNTRVGF